MAIEVDYLDNTIQNFMLAKATMTESSKKAYLSTLSRFEAFCHDNSISLTKVEQKHIAKYLQQFSDNAYKTRLSYKKILNGFYSWMEKREDISSNPVEDVTVKGNSRATQRKNMDKDDFNQIIERAQDLNVLTILNFLWYTGVRAKELIEIRLEDIDMENDTVFVSLSKTSTGNRTIPILPELKSILNLYLKKRLSMDLDHEYLFVNKHGNKMKYRTLLHYVKQSQRGLDHDFACHDFRRAFVTRLYNKTGDIVLCQQLAGHSSIETTRKYILGDSKRLNKFKNLTDF